MSEIKILDTSDFKLAYSPNYSYVFDKRTGKFARWGATKGDDPLWSPAGPEILDLEISSGGCSGGCKFCYKTNSKDVFHNMSFDEFCGIFDKMPKLLTQIAFGITDLRTNPDFFRMMEHARSRGVIPNYTTHGLDLDGELALRTAELCGAVSVSVYEHTRERAYDAIAALNQAGMKQVNIHHMLAQETYEGALRLVNDVASDPRLRCVNAVVFLQLKKKGRAESGFEYVGSVDKYRALIDHCESKRVRVGFDSCSAPLYLKTIEGRKDYAKLAEYAEPCESTLFSSYINCKGEFYPCSFCEGTPGWEQGINVFESSDFLGDVWLHARVKGFRDGLLASSHGCVLCPSRPICRSCPVYAGVSYCKSNGGIE